MEVFHVAIVTKNVEVADKRLSIETGRVAELANGAVILRQGDTVALSTAVMAKEPRGAVFPGGFRLDGQVVSTVLSVDQENDPTILSINGASTALVISDIPFGGPVGAVRMGMLDGKIIVNPPLSRMGESELDLVVAGTADAILMVEAGAKGVTEQTVLEALEMAHNAIKGTRA